MESPFLMQKMQDSLSQYSQKSCDTIRLLKIKEWEMENAS